MSSAERWSRISDVLARALDLPEKERTAYLAEACGREPALRTDVRAYYQTLRDAEGFLEVPAPSGYEAMASQDTFGAYRVVRPLGSGGMGVVYLAERSDGQFTRQVAIKRIGTIAPPPYVLRRFRDEREILAGLDHPNIAGLLDAGVDSGGVPYLVMEYVDGVPFTSHCRERRLTVRDRLGLYLEVCAAVQHAHQNLVIHRDIKPANILVTAAGEPKLLDFGIAKMMDAPVTGDATRTVERALSLDYASPEQVQGRPVTTASDVYSLGVLLYEVLADARPYDASGRSLTDAVALICSEAPPPPSHTAPAERRAQLAGDLDCIVARAMEKAPGDRYASVAELAADVRAHLDYLPIKAHRPSFGYVVRKFAGRHRAGTAIGGAMALMVVGGVSGLLWQARIAERERVRAEGRFQEVRELANFVIFDLQEAVSKLAGSTTLRRTMVERSITYLDSLAGDAAGDAGLQTELAGAYVRLGDVLGRRGSSNLGDRDGALASYDKARALYEQVLSETGSDDAKRRLARLLLAAREAHADASLAGAALQESMGIWEDLVRDDPDSEENLRGLASAYFAAFWQPSDASTRVVSHMEHALEMFDRLLARAPDDPDRKRNVALCHKYLSTYYAAHDPIRALAHALEAERLDGERLAAQPGDRQARVDYSVALGTLADHYFNAGEYDDALERYFQVLTLRRELWEADRSDVHITGRLAYTLARIGETHALSEHHGLAEPMLREAIDRVKEVAPPRRDASYASTLLRAYVYLAEASLVARGDHCLWDSLAAELVRTTPGLLPTEDDERHFVGAIDRAVARAASCGQAQ